VVRATITASIFLIASLVQVKSNPFNSLGVAALIILAIDARQLFDVGFQLSFVAVLSIVYLYPKMNAWISGRTSGGIVRKSIVWTLRVCAVSLAASLGTLPLTAVYFGKVSIIGLLANIFVIPAVGASVVLGFVTITVGLFSNWIASSYAAVNQLLLDCTLWLIRLAGDSSFAYVDTSRFLPIYALPFYAALLLLFNLSVRHVARRFLIIFLIMLNVAVFVPPPIAVAVTGKLRVSFLDVGQGDAAVVELPDGKAIVIDAGPRTGNYDAGERIVAPFLRRRGVPRVDMLIMSHPHDDHLGGIPSVLEQFDVAEILESGQPVKSSTYRRYITDVRAEGCIVDTARSGMPILRIGNLELYVIFPTILFIDSDTTHRSPNLNNTSVVIRMQYRDVSLLFTGDAEMEAEGEMVSRYGDFLHCSLLKTGHHGSKTSSTEEFLDAVHPTYAVISVGRFNKFGHPSEDVISRLHALHAEIYRTDEEGAIIFESDGKTLSRIEWR
jgi:competence protein ComEC